MLWSSVLFAVFFYALTLAIGDFVSAKTKGIVSTVLVVGIIYVIGYFTGLVPRDTITNSGLLTIVSGFGMLAVVTNLGTMININQLIAEWKSVVVSLFGLAILGVIFYLVGVPLFGREYALAAFPPVAGGNVPTLFAFNHILNEADTPNGIRAQAIRDQVISSLKSAYHNHHVQIGWGTDVPYKDFVADPMTEFRLRGEFLDYGSEDMLKQATINSAKLMYMDDQIGTIKAGKMADFVVVDGDPVSNNQVMYQKPDHVIKAGQIIR